MLSEKSHQKRAFQRLPTGLLLEVPRPLGEGFRVRAKIAAIAATKPFSFAAAIITAPQSSLRRNHHCAAITT
ncbi:MAG: hypothetical protein K8I60_08105, partial [Anaerolineae bacterium]|nr:hypothetical protein [Anaerolineae bacterium]